MRDERPTLERIMQLSSGMWAAAILASGAEHALFTHVAGGADTADAVAKKAGISPRGAGALLDGLVGLGLMSVENGRYRNSPDAAEFLVEGKPSYFGGFAKLIRNEFPDWQALPDVVRAGVPAMGATNDPEENPFWEQLVPAIAVLSFPVVHAAAQRLRIAEAGKISILDVGGGSGVYSAIWLGLNPQATATQLDWANVNRIARGYVGRFGVADRLSTIDGDLHTTDFGTAVYDVAVYSHIAHQESPSQNVAIFRKFRKALKPGGTLVISDFVVENDRSGPPFALMFRSTMLLRTTEGSTWTRSEYESWLKQAGFGTVAIEPTGTPATLVYAS